MESEQEAEEKATLRKLLHVSPAAPDEKGNAKNLR